MDRPYVYFYGGEGRKYSVYISPDDGSCIKCPAPAGRGSMGYLIAAVLVVLITSTFSGLLKELLKPHPGIVIAMLAAAVLAESHDAYDIFVRRHDIGFHYRLLYVSYQCGFRQV